MRWDGGEGGTDPLFRLDLCACICEQLSRIVNGMFAEAEADRRCRLSRAWGPVSQMFSPPGSSDDTCHAPSRLS